MRILVAGATGVLGRALLPLLREQGHDVTTLVRRAGTTPGAEVVADALDRAAVHEAVVKAAPDVLVHQLSALRVGPLKGTEETARLRTEGTANLLTAAREAGVRRVVAHSIAFATSPMGPRVLNEDAPLYLTAPDQDWARTVGAVAELERLVLGARGLSGIVLRLGTLYGPGTLYAADGAIGSALANGRFRIPEDANGVTSFVHLDDAARATIAAAEATTVGRFNITDDDPADGRDWPGQLANRTGGPVPREIPRELAERLLGWYTTHQLTALRGAANDRAKQVLGWEPKRPSWREYRGPDD